MSKRVSADKPEPQAPRSRRRSHPTTRKAERGGDDGFDADEFKVEAEPASEPDDLDNLEDFALDQDFNPNEVEHDPPVPCRRPPNDVYFRVRPGAEHTLTVGIYEPTADDGERGDVYLVKKNMLPVFEGTLSQRQLFVCVTPQGKIYLWPAKLPHPGRRRAVATVTTRRLSRAPSWPETNGCGCTPTRI